MIRRRAEYAAAAYGVVLGVAGVIIYLTGWSQVAWVFLVAFHLGVVLLAIALSKARPPRIMRSLVRFRRRRVLPASRRARPPQ